MRKIIKKIIMPFFILLSLFLAGPVSATNWYIDNAVATSGNGQSWNTAWKNFSNINWANIQPGDTIYISGGTTSKTYNELLSVGVSGSPYGYVAITKGKDLNHNGDVLISGASLWVRNRNYINVSGLSIYRVGAAAVSVRDGSHIHINNISIRFGGSGGWGISIDRVGNSVFSNNYIVSDEGNYEGYDGIYQQQDDRNIQDSNIIENNYVDIKHVSQSTHTDAIQIMKCKNMIVRGNYFRNRNTNTVSHTSLFQDCTGTMYYYNNIFVGSPGSSGESFLHDNFNLVNGERGNSTGYIYNNVIISTYLGGGNALTYLGTEGSVGEIKNNILITDNKEPMRISPNVQIPLGALEYNIYYRTGLESSILDWGGARTLSYLRELGNELHGAKVDPGVFNKWGLAPIDYALQSTSPAIDTGISLNNFFNQDKNGVSRPQGSAWDIGAFEYVDASVIYHPADTNQDGCISLGEISAYIGLWLQGQVTLNSVSSGVSEWLGGCQ